MLQNEGGVGQDRRDRDGREEGGRGVMERFEGRDGNWSFGVCR